MVLLEKLINYLQDRYQRVSWFKKPPKWEKRSWFKKPPKWETVTDGIPQGFIFGPLLFLIYVNDIPKVISDISNPVLYADDTSLIIINSDSQMFENDINTAIIKLNKWFNSNLLLLNLEETNFLQFLTKNTNTTHLHISYENGKISGVYSTKFFWLVIDNNLSWHCHIYFFIY